MVFHNDRRIGRSFFSKCKIIKLFRNIRQFRIRIEVANKDSESHITSLHKNGA